MWRSSCKIPLFGITKIYKEIDALSSVLSKESSQMMFTDTEEKKNFGSSGWAVEIDCASEHSTFYAFMEEGVSVGCIVLAVNQ